jgi:hypothetical protein
MAAHEVNLAVATAAAVKMMLAEATRQQVGGGHVRSGLFV